MNAAPIANLAEHRARRRAVAAQWRVSLTQARATSQGRRKRVLAHDDLREQLCRPPLGFDDPAQWNGYVPPATWNGRKGDQANTSPQRTALVRLCAEALNRERAEER